MNRERPMTSQRKLVYEVLLAAADHPTATDIMQRLRENGHKLAYATVYNSLRYLLEGGLIRELNIVSGASRYDARLEPHHHVVCQRCGRVDELLGIETMDYLQVVQRETGYQVGQVDVLAQGVCPDCAAKSPSHAR